MPERRWRNTTNDGVKKRQWGGAGRRSRT